MEKQNSKITLSGETVEKVPKQILGGDTEKNDLTECARINDLTIMKGRETPKNQALTILKGFSTVSEAMLHCYPLACLRSRQAGPPRIDKGKPEE